jgi:tripartite-type tricarboxylate transporter receptor subunit TctC
MAEKRRLRIRSARLTRRDILAGAAAVIAVGPDRVFAQTATRPLRIIVGFPPGGGTDVIARLLADRLRGRYAATVLVENKPGAAARLAVEFVKNAEPDGSVMLFTPDFPITVYPHSFRSLSYDPLRDLAPVAPATRAPLTYVIGPAVPETVGSLRDFLRWCAANPDKASFATTAAGGTPHFVGVLLASEAGVKMTPVHYRGGAPALQDLLGGHVPASVNPVSETLPFAASGKLRILAVTGSQRSKFLPEVPTMREAGYNVVVDTWLGGFVPAKTPATTIAALNAAIGEAVRAPDMIENLAKFGNEPGFLPPDQFKARVKADLERWAPVVKASGFVADE